MGMIERWKYCPECGHTLDSDWKHCAGCGREIGVLGVVTCRTMSDPFSERFSAGYSQAFFVSPTITPASTPPSWPPATFTCLDPGMLLAYAQSCGIPGAKAGNVPTAIRTMLHPDGNDRKEPLR